MADHEFRVLFVCTANLCRSPLAQYLLLDALRQRGPQAARAWNVESAGTHASGGADMHPFAARVLDERSVSHSGFRSRPLDVEAIAAADLVLTAGRQHRRIVVEASPGAVRRTFTIRQFANLADVMPRASATADLRTYLDEQVPNARAHATRTDDDEIADPVGKNIRAFRRSADVIERALGTVVNHLT